MTLDKSAARIQEMFGQIAGRYDFLNRLLSLGIDRSWRRKTVKLVPPMGDAPILDVCTGTADLALAYWRASKGNATVVGTDFCQPMLAIAREKCRRGRGAGGVGHHAVGSRHAAPAVSRRHVSDRLRGVRFAQPGRHRRRAAGNGPRVPARRTGGGAGVLDARRLAAGGDRTAGISSTSCPASARPWLETVRPLTIISRRASAASPRAKRWPSGCGRRDWKRCSIGRLRSEWRRCIVERRVNDEC